MFTLLFGFNTFSIILFYNNFTDLQTNITLFNEKVDRYYCSVMAGLTHKSCSVSAEMPRKKCSVRPRYHINFVLYCSFLFSIFFIMAKHLVLTQHSPPFLPPNLQTLTLRWYNSTLSQMRE